MNFLIICRRKIFWSTTKNAVLYRVEELDKWAAPWYNVFLWDLLNFGRELLENLEYSDNLPIFAVRSLTICRSKFSDMKHNKKESINSLYVLSLDTYKLHIFL